MKEILGIKENAKNDHEKKDPILHLHIHDIEDVNNHIPYSAIVSLHNYILL